MRERDWTEEELQFLHDNYGKHTNQWMADQLGRTKNAVRNRIFRLGYKSTRYYTPEEVEFIKKYAKEKGNAWVAERLGRNYDSIRTYCIKHKIQVRNVWSEKDIEFFESHLDWTNQSLAKKLKRTVSAISTMRLRMGFDSIINSNENLTLKEWSRILGVNDSSLGRWMKRYGFKIQKKGRYRLVSEKEMHRFMKEYPQYWNAVKAEKEFFMREPWFAEKLKADKADMIQKRWGNAI